MDRAARLQLAFNRQLLNLSAFLTSRFPDDTQLAYYDYSLREVISLSPSTPVSLFQQAAAMHAEQLKARDVSYFRALGKTGGLGYLTDCWDRLSPADQENVWSSLDVLVSITVAR